MIGAAVEVVGAVLRIAAGISAAALWFAHDRLTWPQVGKCWLIILAAAVWYALSCWHYPFGYCWCCKGKGAHKRRDGKVFRDCKWWCKGTGRRLRMGRRVYNTIHKRVKHT